MKKIIIANWKMNPQTAKEARRLFDAIKKGVRPIKNTEVVIAPSFVHLSLFKPSGSIKLAAQDLFFEDPPAGRRAYTGEISASMLKDLKVSYVIVGHSERRQYIGESDELISKKLESAFSRGFKTVLCVGEKEREEGGFSDIVRMQLKKALSCLSRNYTSRLIIAYEPLWAISTTKGARADTPQNAFEMTIFIRRAMLDIWGKNAALKIPILYGGSVNSKNAKGFLDVKGISGLLVGGASLKPDEFIKILRLS
uniref:Triosephosphate isomerase n=1 Tax=Candidatus Giovannonibacteria bacterium GW2011_GWF2_42_19 TaxID=1618659 RepID=A0A0G1BK49_9BACT|nr:MAG: Phosphoglycerate kinase [Candidatus Giovannonibacteria bacterium GW2011_GWF2_42_19]